MVLTCVGRSVEGRPIEAYVSRRRGPCALLVLAGMHGDEPKSVSLARRLLELVAAHEEQVRPLPVRHVIVPLVNPDGFRRRSRRNARKVDLNRNFPTSNWEPGQRRHRMFGGESPASEPETLAIVGLVERLAPRRIISVHSISRERHCNNYDGPGLAMARRMQRFNGYPVRASIGYPTPGSFGTWAGRERGIRTITLELPSHHSNARCWEDNRDALLCWLTAPARRARRPAQPHVECFAPRR